MGTTAKINFRAGGTGASGTDWNNTGLRGTPGFPLALDDTSNVSTGWSLDFATTDPDSSRQGEIGVNAVGSGDAAWVNEAECSDDYWWGSTETLDLKFTGLDNAKTYTVEVFGSRENTTGTRTTRLTIGGSSDSINALGNSTLICQLTGISPTSGEIAFDLDTADDNFYLNAARIIEEDATGITIGTTGYTDVEANPYTVTVDGGSNRLFVTCNLQSRSPISISTPTLNGVNPSGTIAESQVVSSTTAFYVHYWLEADLPSAGSYNLSYGTTNAAQSLQWANFSGVLQQAATDSTTDNDGSGSGTVSILIPNMGATDLAVAGGGKNNTSDLDAMLGGTQFTGTLSTTRSFTGWRIGNGNLGWDFASAYQSGVTGVRFQAAGAGAPQAPGTTSAEVAF